MRIGEAVGSIPRNKQDLHPEINWVYWKDTRNRLAHDGNKVNEDVSMDELWEICRYKIPKLLPLLRRILEESEDVKRASD